MMVDVTSEHFINEVRWANLVVRLLKHVQSAHGATGLETPEARQAFMASMDKTYPNPPSGLGRLIEGFHA